MSEQTDVKSIGSEVVDTVVEEVRSDLLSRSQVGIAKYGVTLDREDLDHWDWLEHAYQEALDHALYLKRALRGKPKSALARLTKTSKG